MEFAGKHKGRRDMKQLLVAAALAALLPLAAQAQTAQQLAKGASDTKSVLNYGMGYNLQRFSPLTQINKETVKKLVPVWSYSYDDNRSEESQPLVYKGVLYVTTNSATMAVDAKTGKELWRQNAINFKDGYSMTVAPLVADGVVITGISGAEFGTRLFIDGWEPQTGKHLWRTYTVPSEGEKGVETWAGDTWQHGGGSTWITGSFDPELHTVYWGIGNPGPFNAAVRKGDNLYTDSVLALDPQTGKIKWHFQFSPNDPFDYDSVAEMILADIKVKGKPTKVLMDANRNGFFYVLDRTDGKLLAANAYVKVNWAKGIDMETGRPVETDVATKARAGEKVVLWPSILGGKNWEPMSFNPKTGLAYANTLNCGGHYKAIPAEYKAGDWYLGMDLSDLWEWPAGNEPRGYLKAIDPLTGKAKWQAPSTLPRFSGVLSTAGGVVFSGQLTGELEAFDADTGKKLWQFKTGSGIEGQPVTWEQDGRQYVAVSSGIGGVYSLFSGDERLKDVPAGGSLWVFAVQK